MRLILDNLPITTYDLEESPESIRPGFEVGYAADGRYYINNHLMFKILVHRTNGQYTRARESAVELEAAAVVEVMSGPVGAVGSAPDMPLLLLCHGRHRWPDLVIVTLPAPLSLA